VLSKLDVEAPFGLVYIVIPNIEVELWLQPQREYDSPDMTGVVHPAVLYTRFGIEMLLCHVYLHPCANKQISGGTC